MANSTQIIETPFGAIAIVFIACLLHRARRGFAGRVVKSGSVKR